MESTQRRMIAVAVLVCGFAVGMAGLLNYFKYRSTAERLVAERLVVSGRSLETGIEGALGLGLQFADIGTMPAMVERERATDPMISGIDVFDADGKVLYSTDLMRTSKPVPVAWSEATRRALKDVWAAHDDRDPAVGIVIQNSFGLVIGQVAIRYDPTEVRHAAHAVARDLALNALLVFAVSSALCAGAVLLVTDRLKKDVRAVERALVSGDAVQAEQAGVGGLFGGALKRFMQTSLGAEREIAHLQGRLQGGSGS